MFYNHNSWKHNFVSWKNFLLKPFKVKWSSEQQLKRVIDARLKMTFGKVCWKFFSIIGKK